ncbi:guanylate kinase [Paraburkholderia sp.]|uniref:guanylate kinase n=1 Tax=Paraburkholderia sp. TaxID=1926495 RepID=UPI0039E3EDE0
MRNTIITLTGPSCSGKTTLEGLLKGEGFTSLISTTTRAPREGEVDGQNYYFVDESQFRRLVTQEAFIEHVRFGGNYYGLSVREAKRAFEAGKDVVLVCEPEGLRQISAWSKANDVRHIAVYVDNPPQVIADRFMKRAGVDVAEAMISKSPDDAAKVLKSYASRLSEMLSTEQSWAKLIKSEEINVYVPVFNQENQESAVEVIKAHVTGYADMRKLRPIRQVAA